MVKLLLTHKRRNLRSELDKWSWPHKADRDSGSSPGRGPEFPERLNRVVSRPIPFICSSDGGAAIKRLRNGPIFMRARRPPTKRFDYLIIWRPFAGLGGQPLTAHSDAAAASLSTSNEARCPSNCHSAFVFRCYDKLSLLRSDVPMTLPREVQLDFTPEMQLLYMLFERCHTRNRKRSINQHIKYFNFCSKIQLDHPDMIDVQPADIGWPTGNGMKLSTSQACCLAQLCLAAA